MLFQHPETQTMHAGYVLGKDGSNQGARTSRETGLCIVWIFLCATLPFGLNAHGFFHPVIMQASVCVRSRTGRRVVCFMLKSKAAQSQVITFPAIYPYSVEWF
jgi:hypothetical protein